MTIIEFDYDFLDNKLYPEIEILEKYRNGDVSRNSTGNQCSTFISDNVN